MWFGAFVGCGRGCDGDGVALCFCGGSFCGGFLVGLLIGISILGACAYAGCLNHYGWDAFNDPAPWVCGAVAVGVT